MRHVANSDFDPVVFDGASCAFGVFDGLHKGHRHLIDCAKKTVGAQGHSCIITFDADPDETFHPQRLKKLMDNESRLDALEATGVDDVVVLPFTPALSSLEPRAFLEHLFGNHPPCALHVGEDFHFGAKAAGTVDDLQNWAEHLPSTCQKTQIIPHPLVTVGGSPVTATRIRLLLQEGDVENAARLLGRPPSLRGIVRPGRGQGTKYGFATANMLIDPLDRVLKEGVYAGRAHLDGQYWKAAISVGVSPTFQSESTANIEVHLLDFDRDINGRQIQVEFLQRLRPLKKFASLDDLVSQVTHDITWVRTHVPSA